MKVYGLRNKETGQVSGRTFSKMRHLKCSLTQEKRSYWRGRDLSKWEAVEFDLVESKVIPLDV